MPQGVAVVPPLESAIGPLAHSELVAIIVWQASLIKCMRSALNFGLATKPGAAQIPEMDVLNRTPQWETINSLLTSFRFVAQTRPRKQKTVSLKEAGDSRRKEVLAVSDETCLLSQDLRQVIFAAFDPTVLGHNIFPKTVIFADFDDPSAEFQVHFQPSSDKPNTYIHVPNLKQPRKSCGPCPRTSKMNAAERERYVGSLTTVFDQRFVSAIFFPRSLLFQGNFHKSSS
jgi:hypothetical protein